MALKKLNPAAPARALAGSENLISSAAINFHPTTATFAIKKILARVSVSPNVALIIAGHAGLLQEGR